MGLWFIPAIFGLGYAAKKIYDAMSDDSTPSSSSSLGNKIDAERNRRTEIRRVHLVALLAKTHSAAVTSILAIAAREAQEIGHIKTEKTFYGVDVECLEVNKAIALMKMQMPSHSRGYSRTMDSQSMHFDSLNLSIEEILQVADSRFGPMAGFDNNDTYHKKDDPFMKRLKDLETRSSIPS